jgi:hypothetical protein
MAWNARVLESWHVARDGNGVAVTDPAGLNPDAHLVSPGLREVALLELQLAARCRNHHRAHLGHRAGLFGSAAESHATVLYCTRRARPPMNDGSSTSLMPDDRLADHDGEVPGQQRDRRCHIQHDEFHKPPPHP